MFVACSWPGGRMRSISGLAVTAKRGGNRVLGVTSKSLIIPGISNLINTKALPFY